MAEAVAILGKMLDALLATLEGNIDRSLIDARNAIGSLRSRAEDLLNDAAIGEPLVECFQLCRESGATRIGMDGVRRTMIAQVPAYIPGTLIATSGIFLSLLEQTRILARTTFESRDDIDIMIVTMNTMFDPAEEFAASYTQDPRVYNALVGLHAAVVEDLTDRARPLPRIVRYQFATRMPSLKLAMRIYGDARRADQLVRENRVVHPAFCVSSGRCLSA